MKYDHPPAQLRAAKGRDELLSEPRFSPTMAPKTAHCAWQLLSWQQVAVLCEASVSHKLGTKGSTQNQVGKLKADLLHLFVVFDFSHAKATQVLIVAGVGCAQLLEDALLEDAQACSTASSQGYFQTCQYLYAHWIHKYYTYLYARWIHK